MHVKECTAGTVVIFYVMLHDFLFWGPNRQSLAISSDCPKTLLLPESDS